MRHLINEVHRRGADEDEDLEEEQEDAEAYDENADEDFNPEAAAETAASDVDGSSSSDEEEVAQAKRKGRPPKNRKRARTGTTSSTNAGTEDLDSGDEATIRERDHRKQRRRRQKKGRRADSSSENSAGPSDSDSAGSVIKTRAARHAARTQKAQQHRRPTTLGASTADVDRLWADLAAVPIGRVAPRASETHGTNPDSTPSTKRKVEYAGEVLEVSVEDAELLTGKRTSKLQDNKVEEADPADEAQSDETTLRRPLRRASIFEPNPTGAVKGVAADKLRSWLVRNQLGAALASAAASGTAPIAPWRKVQAQKLTTVQKSAIDWKGFVDASVGLKDELDAYGKSKKGFLAREAFLDRAQGAREVAAREARLKG